MGADIHAFIEYYSKDELTKSNNCYVQSFSCGELYFGRDYCLFGLIAGVRSMCGPIFPLKGIPNQPKISYACASNYYKENSKIKYEEWHSETWLSVDELCCIRKQYLLDRIEFDCEIQGKNKKNLLNFINSMSEKELCNYTFPPHDSQMLCATINTMISLEKNCENDDIQTRLVCWFDS